MTSISKLSAAKSAGTESIDGSQTLKGVPNSGPKAWRIVVVGSTVLWLLVAVATFSDVGIDLIVLGLLFGFGMLLAMAWMFWTLPACRGVTCGMAPDSR